MCSAGMTCRRISARATWRSSATPAPRTHLLERAAGFGARLASLLDELPDLEIAHFRDPWSGMPIVERANRTYQAVYEVNGLPSIELPFHYPAMPPEVLDEIAALERRCLEQADLVITPSQTTADRLPVDAHVVPNGADLPERSRRAPTPTTTSCTSARCSPGRASTPRCGRSPASRASTW